ncbi:MAG: dihydrofolate reductase family protein [Bacilli bacterium]|nr:dihydrofolate reductase family protein [Bacilli bacterium]
MNRPYIICHMVMSIDGKVTGEFLSRPNASKACEVYYELNRNYKADAFACGRVTMEGSFTGGWYPDLEGYEVLNSHEDYIVEEKSGFYAIAFDTKGRLGWKSTKIIDPDEDPGYHNAQIIEVVSQQADKKYLSYLRSIGISYIFAGINSIDVKEAMEKLYKYFNIKTLLLEGGSIINGSFIEADIVDELSLVVDPVVGATNDKSLFYKGNVSEYKLKEIKQYEDSVVWLNFVKE